jgi:RNase P/RNase MRP subunit POP5
MKLKSLKSSAKENKRYLFLESKLSKEDVEKKLLDFIGVLGYSKLGLTWIDKGILAINREEVDKVKAAFTLSKERIKVQRVSGTLKGLGK